MKILNLLFPTYVNSSNSHQLIFKLYTPALLKIFKVSYVLTTHAFPFLGRTPISSTRWAACSLHHLLWEILLLLETSTPTALAHSRFIYSIDGSFVTDCLLYLPFQPVQVLSPVPWNQNLSLAGVTKRHIWISFLFPCFNPCSDQLIFVILAINFKLTFSNINIQSHMKLYYW